MPYIARDTKGTIKAVYAQKNRAASERIPADAPELHSFFEKVANVQQLRRQLNDTDQVMMRVLEDLIETLVAKKVVNYGDFNHSVQRKLMIRKDLRWQMQKDDTLRLDDLDYLDGEDDEVIMDNLRRNFL